MRETREYRETELQSHLKALFWQTRANTAMAERLAATLDKLKRTFQRPFLEAPEWLRE